MKQDIQTDNLYSKIAELLKAARQSVVRNVNQTMAYTYFEIGRMIVEEEQQGNERAEYGKYLIKNLSTRLQKEFEKGFSERNLEQMRQFYLVYSIPQTVSAESQIVKSEIPYFLRHCLLPERFTEIKCFNQFIYVNRFTHIIVHTCLQISFPVFGKYIGSHGYNIRLSLLW